MCVCVSLSNTNMSARLAAPGPKSPKQQCCASVLVLKVWELARPCEEVNVHLQSEVITRAGNLQLQKVKADAPAPQNKDWEWEQKAGRLLMLL